MIENLDELHREIIRLTPSAGIALFHALPGSLDSHTQVEWDIEQLPDFNDYLDTAKIAGARILILSRRVFEDRDLEEALEDAADAVLSRDERQDVESGLRTMQRYIGATSSVEAAFESGGVLYAFSAVAPWFEEFLRITDIIDASVGDEDAGPLPGLYSNN